MADWVHRSMTLTTAESVDCLALRSWHTSHQVMLSVLAVTQFTNLSLITTFVRLLANRHNSRNESFVCLSHFLSQTYFAFSSLQIRIWFQNRRARDKREKRSEEMPPKSDANEESIESCGPTTDGVPLPAPVPTFINWCWALSSRVEHQPKKAPLALREMNQQRFKAEKSYESILIST